MSGRSPSASTSSASSPPVLTPSSTTITFGEQRQSSPSFSFRAQTPSNRTTPVPSTTTSGTPRFTSPSSEEGASTPPFTSEGQSRPDQLSPAPSSTTSRTPRFTPSSTSSSTSGDDLDPDVPLPSVEGDVSAISSRQSTPSTTLYTPSTSTHADSTRPAPDQDAVLQQIGDLRDLRLTSPPTQGSSSSQRDTPTPSIHISPSAPPNERSQLRASRTDSIVGGVTALHLDSLQAESPHVTGLRESRSPSPSRRRRSGSAITREPYQVENEEPPRALFHMPQVQAALANARTLTSRMVNVLRSSTLHGESESEIRRLYQQATILNVELPPTRIVGLVGDSGVGKSSLINSLLDKKEFARASNRGTACTCAVTEYIFHEADDFVVHVDYFSLDELKTQFEDLLTAYRESETLPGSPGNGDEDEGVRGRTSSERRADLAKETFKASFRERLEQMPTVLSSMPFGLAVGTMVEWASHLLSQQVRQESFSTAEECSSRLRELTSNSDDNGASRTPWPLIQKLRVYLNAYILRKGLIIADLPGLRDLNLARKAITQRHVRECHQIFVVTTISRAIIDESVRDIFDLAGSADLSKLDIICTRSEDFQLRGEQARHDYPAEGATIEEMQEQIEADTREISSLREEIDEYEQDTANLTREDEDQLRTLHRDCRKAETSKETHEFALLRLLMRLRNDTVSHHLQERYQTDSVVTTNTFCVSNTLYWDNRERSATAALPHLQLSGIPELRRYCIGIVAESHLRATREFIQDELPAFLVSVRLWVEAGSGRASAARRQQIRDAVSAIQRELYELTSPISQLNSVSRTLFEKYNSQIHLRMRQSGPRWSDNARQASMDWRGWHHMSYKAFCSNYGEHSTNAVGYHCWNEEAMGRMKRDMSDIWSVFVVDLEAHLEHVNDEVDEAFDTVLEIALSTGSNESGVANNTGSSMRTLAEALHHRQDITLHGIDRASESFQSELGSLNTNAFSSIRTAFTGKLMETIYHAANMEYGTGSDHRRKDLITRKFSSSSLLDNHRRNCKESFRDIARGLQDKLKEIVNQQVGLVEADLHMLSNENVVLESERDPEFRTRVGAVVESVTAEVETIGRVFGDVS